MMGSRKFPRFISPRTRLCCPPPRSRLLPAGFYFLYEKSRINRALSIFRPVKGRGTQSLPVSFAGPFRAGYPSAAASGLLPRDVSFSKRLYSRTH